ncbi:hypothetical protein HDU67_000198 [Dinochytrium kinnereticum]|nr:hypothetical protein HDU67_000198 [Dinochytrium kinnereticum]
MSTSNRQTAAADLAHNHPTFDGTNEHVFREELVKLYSQIKLSGSKASDPDIVNYVVTHCFPNAEHAVWGYANATVTIRHLYALSDRYRNMPITNPFWEGIVASFQKLRSRMVTKPTDPEMVDFIMSPMSNTMKTGVTDAIL